jgi:hypothetical protein
MNLNNGISQLTFFPPLIVAVPTSQSVTIYDVPFQVYNINDTQEYKYSVGLNNNIVLELQEAL